MKIFFILLIFLSNFLIAEEEEKKDEDKSLFKFVPSGYVKLDSFFDSRQNVSYKEGIFLLYPKKKQNDAFEQNNCPSGDDVNAHPQFNMVANQTNLGVNIIGPKIKNINILGRVEADFIGLFNLTNEPELELITDSLFHLRKAYLNLDWFNSSLLFGQTYHPLFIPDCCPNPVSFNLGNPFEAVSRNIQIRFTYFQPQNFELVLAALNESADFADNGPNGPNPQYLRNSAFPILNLRFKKNINENNIVWFCLDYKRIIPRLVSDAGCKVKESLHSLIMAGAYSHYSNNTRICLKNIYAQNGSMHGLLGGYAISQQDPTTNQQKYTNLNAYSIWLDVERKCCNFTPGVFIGFAKNLGASESLFPIDETGLNFETFTNFDAKFINNVFRISPRLLWDRNNVRFAGEIECTRAAFGTLISNGNVIDTIPVTNIRLLFAAYYFF